MDLLQAVERRIGLGQHRAPLFDKLVRYSHSGFVRAHVPGHKGRAELDQVSNEDIDPYLEEVRTWFGRIMQLDWTEVPGLDNLHQPQSVIQEAERLASECFGADVTRFLVGGSTSGNLAAVLALCNRGDVLIVQRDAHQSILNGIALAGAKAVFLPMETDRTSGLPAPARTEQIEEALWRYPQAKGVFLTYPNYYGVGGNLREAAQVIHAHGKPLIVDEAHGAHYGFHPELPPSALACGADLVVQSTHKMLTALTMGGMIHLRRGRIPEQRLMRALAAVQSSSPSYPIMASLDLARWLIATSGKERITRALRSLERLRRSVERSGYWAIDGAISQDPFKIVIRDIGGGRTGIQLRDELQRHGCLAEMADPERVLLALSLMTVPEDVERIEQALTALQKEQACDTSAIVSTIASANKSTSASARTSATPFTLSMPVELLLNIDAPTECLPLHECIGKRAAETVTPYPPGIPVVYPGEVVSEEHVRAIERWRASGVHFQGCEDETAEKLSVLI